MRMGLDTLSTSLPSGKEHVDDVTLQEATLEMARELGMDSIEMMGILEELFQEQA